MVQPATHCMIALLTASAIAFANAQTRTESTQPCRPDSTVTLGDFVVMSWHHPRMTVIGVPDTLGFLYRPHNDAPLDSVARQEHFRCIVNASFFDGVRGNATHAGFLSLYGHPLTPAMDDRQLTHIVRIDGTLGSIAFLPVRSFLPSDNPHAVEFQTGPLVIDSGVIRNDLIRSSINGSTPHTRTLLATLNRHRSFLITVTDRVSLFELADILPRLDVFQGKRLDVINLDGGSSVALYIRDLPRWNYNADDRLPILIGFH